MSSMNRQSRWIGQERWTDRGNVTLEQAAIAHYKEAALNIPAASIQVRDQGDPSAVWVLTVTPQVTYEVSGLRGGDNG
jgi:hypothetical protein